MIQSKMVNELLKIYKGIEKSCKKNQEDSLFYSCLKSRLRLHANKFKDAKIVLEDYEIACKSYLDSKLIEFNIGIVTVILSLIGIFNFSDIKMQIEENNSFNVVLIVAVVLVAHLGICMHKRKRKLLEIYDLLRKILNEETSFLEATKER